jgi:DNA polymerase-3 subunit chi
VTSVDFYILQDTDSDARWQFACRLIEKAQGLGRRILVAVDGPEAAKQLDDQLWEFKPESFVPHRLLEDSKAPAAPVEITWGDNCGEHHDVLINLASSVPEYFSRFERLSEVVIQSPEVLKNTRDHYRFYQQRGYPIERRNISSTKN